MELSVIIPVYNEEANVSQVYERLEASLKFLQGEKEYLFVNDGSKDKSIDIIRELAAKDDKVKYIDFSRNFGHQVAITAGLEYCKGKAVVIMDSDHQDPPELIEQLYSKYKEGFEVVYAKRRKRKGEGFFKKLTAKLFYRILRKITAVDIPVDTGDFRIIDRKVVDYLNRMPEQNKFIRGQIAWIGFRQAYVEYDRDKRKSGKSGYSIRKMFGFAVNGVTSFSNFPLRLTTLAGFFVSGVAFVLMIYTFISKYYLDGYVPGWASLMVTILFIGGIQMIGIGIMGEYIARIASQVRNRPLYVVNESNVSHPRVEGKEERMKVASFITDTNIKEESSQSDS